MKKIFTFLCLLMLGMSMTVWADPYPLYQNISYCKLRRQTAGGTKFDIYFWDASDNCKLYVSGVEVGSQNIIEGMHRVPLYSNSKYNCTTYFYDKDNDQACNPSGSIAFYFTGRFSETDPIYKVRTILQGYDLYGNAYQASLDKEIPIRIYDNNNTQYTIVNNAVQEVNIPGNTSHVASSSEGYFNYTGESENRLFRFESTSDSYEEGRYYGLGKYVDGDYTWSQSLPSGSNEVPNDASCNITISNGFYFLDSYFNYSSVCYHVTMQHPNYQAVNNAYSETFDWDDVTLTRRADFATSGVVTLTATNASNKKVVLDFVVDIDEVGTTGDIVIPAGDYTVSTSETTGTVIASGGINTDLTVKNSYAGTTTALTSSNYSTNPLWCFRTGTITVAAGMSTITVSANQSYRGSPVDITINGPVLEGSYNVSTGVNPSGAGYITGTVGEAAFADGTYDAGTSITLTAHNNAGWRFDKWNNNATANPYTFVLLKDTSLTAQFIKTYVVTVNDDGRGTVTGGNTYDVNEVAQLSATSNNEHLYFFQKWQKLNGETYEDFVGNTANPINVTVSADATYKAVFRQASNGTITANASPVAGGYVVVNQSSTAGGTAVTLTVNENDGYAFTGWADGGNDNPRIVYVDGDYEYTAQFVEGVEIVVLDGTCNDESGYFNFLGSVNGYDVRIESASVALRTGDFSASQLEQTNNYTYVKKNSTHVTLDYSRQSANVSILDHTHLLMEAWEYDTSGKPYHISIKAPLPNSKEIDSRNSAYNVESFPSVDDVTAADEEGKAWIYANKGGSPGTGYYVYNTWLAFMPDNTKYGKIPSGTYPIKGTEEVGTAVGGYNLQLNGSGYLSSMDGCVAQRRNGYVENIWIPVDGTIEVTNVNETYYVNVLGKSSYKQNVYFTMGSAPHTLTISSDTHGSVNTSFYANNWGKTVTYDEDVANPFFNGQTITLQPVAESGYEFDSWTGGTPADNGDGTYSITMGSSNIALTANFHVLAVNYTVTFNDYNGDQLQSSNVEENTQPTVTADPTRDDDATTAYTFVGWKSSADDNVYATANLPVATAAVTYTAQYEPYFLLLDDKTDNNDAYYTALANKEGERLNVKYMRTFTAGRWATFSLPFGYSYRPEENTTFKGQVYYLISAKYTADGYLTLNCMPVTDGLVANKPYILIPSATIENPTFKNVKMKAVAPNYYTAPNTEGIGTGVTFRNTIERETLEKDKRVIYIKGANNQLYYPSMSVDTWMRPFRGYFYLNVTPEQIQYTPARVRLVTPDGEYIEQAPDTDQPAAVETKKYIENGILIIERAGIKYDAQGHVIK